MSPGLATELAQDLPWGALADAAREPLVSPGVRSAIEAELAGRWELLTRGERIALARRATTGTLRAALPGECDPAVREAARGNPCYRLGLDAAPAASGAEDHGA